MGKSDGNAGESSGRKKSERGGGGDEERPFKKARYVWEVKGKYHLKDAYKNKKEEAAVAAAIPNEDEEAVSSCNGECEETAALNNNNNNNNNNEEDHEAAAANNNNSSCSDRCCIEAILARSDVLMDSDDSGDAADTQKNIDKSISDEIPVTLVTCSPKNQDYYLRRWQARQVAKGFVDNTINRVLEHWMVAPFDAADLIDNCDNDGQVEDEGIMMAIQSHGLRSGLGGDGSFDFENQGGSGVVAAASQPRENRKQSPISFVRPQEMAESALDNYENVHNERVKRQETDSNMSCDESSQPSLEMDDPADFLSAAVSVAIKKKGLSSYNYG